MKEKRWWRDEEEENSDVNGCSDEWTDVSRYGLKAKTPKKLNIVIFNISVAPLFSGLSGITLLRPSMVKKLTRVLGKFGQNYALSTGTFFSTNLLLSFFPRCRLAGYQLLQSASNLRVLAYSFVPRFPLPLVTKGDWNQWRRWKLEWEQSEIIICFQPISCLFPAQKQNCTKNLSRYENVFPELLW